MHKQSAAAMDHTQAERIGLLALVFLTEDADRLGRFLESTGLSPGELRDVASTPEGQAAILDHLLGDESLLMVFAAGASVEPGDVEPAREVLAGGGNAARGASSSHHTARTAANRAAGKKPSRRWPGPGV